MPLKQDNRIPVTAVFDIGKTNKKFLLFDEQYKIVFKEQISPDEIKDDDGDPCEDLDLLVSWIKEKFESTLQHDEFRITALNFSTYGATLVHLDDNGEPVTPLYNYLKGYPADLLDRFYDLYGGRSEFSVDTASPPMGMLNSGLQLFWMKHRKPEFFEKIRHTLHFPQYLSYLFTGKVTAELTSIGCHTGMWNFKKNDYHQWLKTEGVKELIPSVLPVSTTYVSPDDEHGIRVGMGIHDSSAALAPYLVAFDEPFLQISSGTWSISFNPFNTDPLTYKELQRDCLCYMNIYGDQVKASRLLLGQEYEHQKKKLESHFGRDAGLGEPELDGTLLAGLVQEDDSDKKVQLELAHSSGPYPSDEAGNWDPAKFDSFEEGYHQMMLDLVSIQADCIDLIGGDLSGEKLIVTGGFSQNDFFLRILASRFPDKKVYTASLSHATALGAAMVMNSDEPVENDMQKELLNLKLHKPLEDTGIEDYRWSSQ